MFDAHLDFYYDDKPRLANPSETDTVDGVVLIS